MARSKVGKCVHFTGIQNATCKAGIAYETLPKPVCCIFGDDKSACASYRDPTPEEVAADEAEIEAVMAKFRVVMTGIAPWRKANKGRSHAEVVECPACKGRLHLSISSYNGHVHGKCETAGCVSWME